MAQGGRGTCKGYSPDVLASLGTTEGVPGYKAPLSTHMRGLVHDDG
jgi:hypothetical protein